MQIQYNNTKHQRWKVGVFVLGNIRKRRTHEDFINELSTIDNTIKINSIFKNTLEKVQCECISCGHTWKATPDNLLHGKGCKYCKWKKTGLKHTKSTDAFVQEMKILNPNIEILGKYIGAHEKIDCKCIIHDVYFSSSPTHMLNGKTGCAKCAGEKISSVFKLTHEEFCERLFVVNRHIDIIGRYTRGVDRVEVRCTLCNHKWQPIASSLLAGFGCPHCCISKGESRIEMFLIDNNILFEPQKKYSNLRGVGGRLLSYDFYLPYYNLLIEYQGQFHDGTVSIQSKEELAIQQTHDAIKKIYAEKNKINLLCVWYYEYDEIENILSNNLNLQNPVTITA